MSNDAPVTITRFFDPTVWGLRKNQLVVLFIAAGITALSLGLKFLVFPHSLIITVIAAVIIIIAWIVFIRIGLDRNALYHVELAIRFWGRRAQGEESIQKYDKKDENKVKNFNRIKRVLKGGYVEFWPRAKGNNWGGYLKLFSYAPLNPEVFYNSAEEVLSSAPDGTIMKTILAARRDLSNKTAAQYERELKKPNLHPIIRDNLYEHVAMCQKTNTKRYSNYMFFSIPYTTSEKTACGELDTILKSAQREIKQQLGIESIRLETEDEINAMFDELITHNHIISKGEAE